MRTQFRSRRSRRGKVLHPDECMPDPQLFRLNFTYETSTRNVTREYHAYKLRTRGCTLPALFRKQTRPAPHKAYAILPGEVFFEVNPEASPMPEAECRVDQLLRDRGELKLLRPPRKAAQLPNPAEKAASRLMDCKQKIMAEFTACEEGIADLAIASL